MDELNELDEIQRFKEHILKEFPRLKPDHVFRFDCHHGVSCFNECCGNVNIFLTPYDIIRLKNRLGITSGEFLDRYTITPFSKDSRFPVVILRMGDDEKKKCQFNSPDGCTVYEDRPWACRMYPLGMASPGDGSKDLEDEFYFLLQESTCKGFACSKEQTIEEYRTAQGVAEYEEHSEGYKQLTTHRYFAEGQMLSPEKMDMFYTVCYDIDSFRKFILNSSFLNKFEIDADIVEKIKEDDVELLKLGYRWLRFSLFGEPTIKINSAVLNQRKGELQSGEAGSSA